ncbi:MAG TPA: VOC family protein [Tepidisphaeraceae bacterium]|jgi:uncharacterized glyoxalase superfamily protein PhnB|nr:VOC family protein [Tepidisphaeraceae bacterium]
MPSKIPPGFNTITPHLHVRGGRDAIAFYKKAFGAEEVSVLPGPGNSIMHAQLRIGNSPLMLGEECKDRGIQSPLSLGAASLTLHLYVDDVDASFQRAVDAGCKVKMPPANMFWGDRYAMLSDPFGHVWSLATHIEDLSHDEIQRRGAEMMKQMSPQK